MSAWVMVRTILGYLTKPIKIYLQVYDEVLNEIMELEEPLRSMILYDMAMGGSSEFDSFPR